MITNKETVDEQDSVIMMHSSKKDPGSKKVYCGNIYTIHINLSGHLIHLYTHLLLISNYKYLISQSYVWRHEDMVKMTA